MQKCISLLSTSEINEILQNTDIQLNKIKLSNENVIKFSISLPNEIKIKIENELSIQLQETVPMRWIKGDTLPHIDKGETLFKNTYLIYLTDSDGNLNINGINYPIIAGNAHVFNEGLEHSVINSTNYRLMIGPVSENGIEVGAPGNIYYFLNRVDAENFDNIIFDNNSITIENVPSNINTTLSNINSWMMLNSNNLVTPDGPYTTGHEFNLDINYFLYPATLISNICFPKDTPILTDQGIVKIQDITNQTIYGLKVEHVTQTISLHKELVCFEKDSISIGYPSQKTIMTRNHKVFNGTMVNADRLLNNNIYLIPYNGEILYNVLLEKNGYMSVNRLICETLDINNVVALYYKSNYTKEEKSEMMKLLNKNINTNTKKYRELLCHYFTKYVV